MEKLDKDWIGNRTSVYAQLGASSHSDKEREQNDYYATNPDSLKLFLNKINKDDIKLNQNIWECACGEGHLSKLLINEGYNVYSTDLINRNFGKPYIDFLKEQKVWDGDILTNPPYKYAREFVEHSMKLLKDNNKCIMFLKIQFLEGKERKKLFEKYPPKYVYVNSARQLCYLNGDLNNKISSATCYCWFIWEKGFKGEPIIRWI